ncbi:MAG: AAA family ATPase [Alphaproteobacteria bacterium]
MNYRSIDERDSNPYYSEEAKQNAASPTKVKIISLGDFLQKEFPPRRNLIEPFLPEAGLAMVYAERGIGKTWFSLSLAYAVASGGSFLKWHAPEARKVLLLDGEMPANILQERLKIIVDNAQHEATIDALAIITPDLQEFGTMPDLATKEGQQSVAQYVQEADLIIVDNISTLCRTGKENDSESWIIVQEWALQLRAQGKAVLFIHHAGKNGGQRGSSKKEDVLDTVISLKKPPDYENEGARFEIHFEKHRGFYGEDAQPFEASLTDGQWTYKPIDNVRDEQVRRLNQEGYTYRQIAEKVGLGKSTVERIINKNG